MVVVVLKIIHFICVSEQISLTTLRVSTAPSAIHLADTFIITLETEAIRTRVSGS